MFVMFYERVNISYKSTPYRMSYMALDILMATIVFAEITFIAFMNCVRNLQKIRCDNYSIF